MLPVAFVEGFRIDCAIPRAKAPGHERSADIEGRGLFNWKCCGKMNDREDAQLELGGGGHGDYGCEKGDVFRTMVMAAS